MGDNDSGLYFIPTGISISLGVVTFKDVATVGDVNFDLFALFLLLELGFATVDVTGVRVFLDGDEDWGVDFVFNGVDDDDDDNFDADNISLFGESLGVFDTDGVDFLPDDFIALDFVEPTLEADDTLLGVVEDVAVIGEVLDMGEVLTALAVVLLSSSVFDRVFGGVFLLLAVVGGDLPLEVEAGVALSLTLSADGTEEVELLNVTCLSGDIYVFDVRLSIYSSSCISASASCTSLSSGTSHTNSTISPGPPYHSFSSFSISSSSCGAAMTSNRLCKSFIIIRNLRKDKFSPAIMLSLLGSFDVIFLELETISTSLIL